MQYQSIKGFRDILPEDSATWQWLEERIHALMKRYGYGEVRLPIVESTELFKRGIGEGTDVVGKEMYTFDDRAEPPESLTLRPELTAGVARAYVEHAIAQSQPLSKWYYVGPLFRYEQPQAGRYRQFHQFGMELIGSPHPEADAEVILAGYDLLTELGITRFKLRLNSIGTQPERVVYREALLAFLRERQDQLSADSVRRMEGNPLRVLDSKKTEDVRATAEAPAILDYLEEESRAHFAEVRSILDANGIEYTIDNRLVRGLDYYTRTAFEFQGLDLGAQDALCGGGRYDSLIEQVGGKPTPAVGFSFGMERLLIAIKNAGAAMNTSEGIDAYLIALDEGSRRWAAMTAHTLRRAGLKVEHDLLRRSMKAQMRDANRRAARKVVIVGETELAAELAQVKDMQTHEQRGVAFDALAADLMQSAAPVAEHHLPGDGRTTDISES